MKISDTTIGSFSWGATSSWSITEKQIGRACGSLRAFNDNTDQTYLFRLDEVTPPPKNPLTMVMKSLRIGLHEQLPRCNASRRCRLLPFTDTYRYLYRVPCVRWNLHHASRRWPTCRSVRLGKFSVFAISRSLGSWFQGTLISGHWGLLFIHCSVWWHMTHIIVRASSPLSVCYFLVFMFTEFGACSLLLLPFSSKCFFDFNVCWVTFSNFHHWLCSILE